GGGGAGVRGGLPPGARGPAGGAAAAMGPAREPVFDLGQRVVAAVEPDEVLAVAEHAFESGHVVRQVEAAAREREERAVAEVAEVVVDLVGAEHDARGGADLGVAARA